MDDIPIEHLYSLGMALGGPYARSGWEMQTAADEFRSAWAERFGKVMPLDDLCVMPVNISVVDGTREYRMCIYHEPDSRAAFLLRFDDIIKMRRGPVDGPDGRTGRFARPHEALMAVTKWLRAGRWCDANP